MRDLLFSLVSQGCPKHTLCMLKAVRTETQLSIHGGPDRALAVTHTFTVFSMFLMQKSSVITTSVFLWMVSL